MLFDPRVTKSYLYKYPVDCRKAHNGLVHLVTEAMKLETVIKAPIDGHVREIVAGAGESVEAGDLLVVIDEGAPT